jgi:hypothetical protein
VPEVSVRRAHFNPGLNLTCARPHERINGGWPLAVSRNDSREERVAEHRSEGESRSEGAERLALVIRSCAAILLCLFDLAHLTLQESVHKLRSILALAARL